MFRSYRDLVSFGAAYTLAMGISADTLEEIIVTAQMRDQNIETVPMALSVRDSQFLQDYGIVNFEQLADLTPGLIVQEQSANNVAYVIRGISTDESSPSDASRLSIFLNGIDVSRNRGSMFEMHDIERIEIIKGPQATLFGTAASSGAISTITRRPQQEFEGSYRIELGSYNNQRFEGAVTGGNSLFQGRIALLSHSREGYIGNLVDDEKLMGIDRISLRPSLRWTPDETLTADLITTYEVARDSGTAFRSGVYPTPGGTTNPFEPGALSGSPMAGSVFEFEDLGVRRQTRDVNLNISKDLANQLRISSLTGWRTFDSYEVFDGDGSQAWAFETAEDAEGRQFTQEIRVNYSGERLDWVAGASFFTETGSRRVPVSTEEGTFILCVPPARIFATLINQNIQLLGGPNLGLDQIPCLNPDGSVNSITPLVTPFFVGFSVPAIPYDGVLDTWAKNRSRSLFVDGTWRVNDRLELTAGARYLHEKRTTATLADVPLALLTNNTAPLVFFADTGGARLRAGNRSEDILPRVAASFALQEQTHLFASIGKGRRAPVTDVTPALDPQTLAPLNPVSQTPAEVIWNYEAGLRGRALDARLYYSASVYLQDYSNFQVQLLTPGGQFVTDDAGSARNTGFELELTYQLWPGSQLFANYAYIDAGIANKPENGVYAGRRFRLQPENTASTGVSVSVPLGDSLLLSTAATLSYRDEVYFDLAHQPTEQISGLRIADDGATLVNLRFALTPLDARWRAELFANNLFDEEYLLDGGNIGASFGAPTFIPGRPRMVGVSFGGTF